MYLFRKTNGLKWGLPFVSIPLFIPIGINKKWNLQFLPVQKEKHGRLKII